MVLPEGYLQNPERMARFRREGSYSLPSEHCRGSRLRGGTGVNALVMEFVEGPTLDRVIVGASSGPGQSESGRNETAVPGDQCAHATVRRGRATELRDCSEMVRGVETDSAVEMTAGARGNS